MSSMKTFLNSIGDTNGAGELQKMKQLIQKARNGDKHAIKFFRLKEIPQLQMQAVKQVLRFYKFVNLYQCYQTYAQVGKLVNNTTFSFAAEGTCSYIVWMTAESEPTEKVVDGSDISTSLLEKLCRRKIFTYEGQRMEDEVKEREEVGVPSYQPEEAGETSQLSEDSEPMEDEPTSKPASSSKQPKKATKKRKEEI